MTILHLTTFLQGGAGLVIATLAASQRRAGHQVVVVTSATGAPGYGNYPGHLESLRKAGVTLHLVDSLFKREPADNLQVVAFIQREYPAGFDVIHAHAAVPAQAGLTLSEAGRTPTPVLQTMHGWGVAKSESQTQSDVAVMNLVDRITVPATTSASLMESLGVAREKVVVIPYGVGPIGPRADVPHPVEAEMTAWRARGGWAVCCSGTIGERKNQRVLVDALAEMPTSERPLCVFVGDGDALGLARHTTARSVAEWVRAIGYRPDARHLVAGADFFVLPSLSEGLPLAVLEAFCDGVPVLASDIPEIREAVTSGATGWLFDPEDPASVARVFSAVRKVDAGTREAVTARARARYEERYSVERMTADYEGLYETLARG